MMLSRITPRAVWFVLVASFCTALVQRGGVLLGYWTQAYNPNTPFALMMAAAYVVALAFCVQIARDHVKSPAMRFAWMLFAGSSAMSIVRHLTQALVASMLIPGFGREASYIPIQLPMALALVLLFAGLLSMWSAFKAVGLGFHPRRIDILVVTLMLLILPPILIRNAERLPAFVSGWMVLLPFAGAILLPACGAIAVLLHRMAVEMRGGETARALLFLIWYPGLRLAAMMATVEPFLTAVPVVSVLTYAVYQTAPLVFTLGLAYRWRIAVKASAALEAESETWSDLYPIATSIH